MTDNANSDDVNRDDAEPGDAKPDDVNTGDVNAGDVNAGDVSFAEDPAVDRGTDEPTLIVDVGGFEGPLDLLLTLARQQKVDLAKISILALANQYLAFIEQARRTRLN